MFPPEKPKPRVISVTLRPGDRLVVSCDRRKRKKSCCRPILM
ncbi:hypothetical protein [Heliorestis convoluta]|uniref:Uncharacterized protein n=1 Tax=Heliorestis convoluta TaxID=356322 RepID=A0A5Q2N1B6_9FIRM|nr:hypothetical protein [Heliorestis convoluta]QGG47603.1 hypothetical protein FTV88_1456 [Heliorestis convoluta]